MHFHGQHCTNKSGRCHTLVTSIWWTGLVPTPHSPQLRRKLRPQVVHIFRFISGELAHLAGISPNPGRGFRCWAARKRGQCSRAVPWWLVNSRGYKNSHQQNSHPPDTLPTPFSPPTETKSVNSNLKFSTLLKHCLNLHPTGVRVSPCSLPCAHSQILPPPRADGCRRGSQELRMAPNVCSGHLKISL